MTSEDEQAADANPSSTTARAAGEPLTALPLTRPLLRCPREYRDALVEEIAAENALITNRMMWNLTFQGFLFTGFALALDKNHAVTKTFLMVVPIAGILAAAAALVGMAAALRQIYVLQQDWKTLQEQLKEWGPQPFSNKWGDRAGRLPPLVLPFIIIVAWSFVLGSLR